VSFDFLKLLITISNTIIEEVANWEELVEYSKATGELGNKGVTDLDNILYARN